MVSEPVDRKFCHGGSTYIYWRCACIHIVPLFKCTGNKYECYNVFYLFSVVSKRYGRVLIEKLRDGRMVLNV